MADGPLDMRMDPTGPVDAASWLAEVDEVELARVLFEYGDERTSSRYSMRCAWSAATSSSSVRAP